MPLPAALQEIDIAGIARLEPRELFNKPASLVTDARAAGRALAYSRSSDADSYDAVGFRVSVASPKKGPSPLQTSAMTALQRDIDVAQKEVTLTAEILEQQGKLRHRAIAIPNHVETTRYELDRVAVHLFSGRTDAVGREIEDRWTFSLTDVPEVFLMGAEDRDEVAVGAQQVAVALQATHWLPFSILLSDGIFGRFQDVRARLVRTMARGTFYCFVSHRWLTPKHPDPEARQAQFTAWQLMAYLVEAVRVASQRGLHKKRRFSPQLGTAIGPRGSDLAEALIVNALRPTLTDETLRTAAAEALELEPLVEDYGVAKASTDAGLVELRELLATRPTLRGLTERMHLWYDYSCLPQPPREGDDVKLFRTGLQELVAAQILGRTSIMLDDADDYLSRAWCTLEGLVADSVAGATDLLVGSARRSAVTGEVEHYFEQLLADRPHVVWRAVLDTELFGVQTSSRCMERLGLRVTDPNDLPFLYERLRGLGAPRKVHVDHSEIVTGAFPLPALKKGAVVVRARHAGASINPYPILPPTAALDWTHAMSLETAWDPSHDSVAATPPFRRYDAGSRRKRETCHVAVVGASEGEAILFANWVHKRRSDLETLLDRQVASISWVASDIAPVGHMAVSTLEGVPVTADGWVVVSTSTRFQHCIVTQLITESLKWARVPYATVAVDNEKYNLKLYDQVDPPKGIDLDDLRVIVDVAKHPPTTHVGGLFKWQIVEELL